MPKPTPEAAAGRILVVDDQRNLLITTVLILESHGYVVHSARSGEEALAILADHEVDVMLADLKMEPMDGLTLLQKAQERSPDAPDDDNPPWTEQDRAAHCRDCCKLFIPTSSPHLPKEICYHCHLARERAARLKKGQPGDTGNRGSYWVTHRGGEVLGGTAFHNAGAYPSARDESIAGFFEELQKPLDPRHDVTLSPQETANLREVVQSRLETLLKGYTPPQEPRRFARSHVIFGETYVLDVHRDEEHGRIAELHGCHEMLARCTQDAQLSLFGNAGISQRALEVLMFLQQRGARPATRADVALHLPVLGGPQDIHELIRELEALRCLAVREDEVTLTLKGKVINIAGG